MRKWDINQNTFAWNPFRCNNLHISNNGNTTRESLRAIYHPNHFIIIIDILYLHTYYCFKSVMRYHNVSCLVEVKNCFSLNYIAFNQFIMTLSYKTRTLYTYWLMVLCYFSKRSKDREIWCRWTWFSQVNNINFWFKTFVSPEMNVNMDVPIYLTINCNEIFAIWKISENNTGICRILACTNDITLITLIISILTFLLETQMKNNTTASVKICIIYIEYSYMYFLGKRYFSALSIKG